jgi:hypothetical protein
MKIVAKLAAALVIGLVANGAQAATFKFDGKGWKSNASSLSFQDDGLTVTATAATYSNPRPVGSTVTFNDTPIDLNNWGLISKRNRFDEHVVDGNGANEVILLDFGSELVELTGARFRWTNGYNFSSNGRFDFFADGVFLGRSSYANAANIFDGVTASVFGIGASRSDTGFKLAGVSAEISAVPLPATGLLMLGAMAGAGALGRRRKAS